MPKNVKDLKERLLDAVNEKDSDTVRLLLGAGADPAAHNEYDDSLLSLACSRGCPDIVRLLLDHGADVNDGNNEFEETPLHTACLHGHADIVKILLSRVNCEINAMNDRRRTPLHDACRRRHTNVARLLIGKGADVDARDEFGFSPLDHAFGLSGEGREVEECPPQEIIHLFQEMVPEYTLDYVTKLPVDHPHREEIIDWYREHRPELVMEKFCTNGPGI